MGKLSALLGIEPSFGIYPISPLDNVRAYTFSYDLNYLRARQGHKLVDRRGIAPRSQG